MHNTEITGGKFCSLNYVEVKLGYVAYVLTHRLVASTTRYTAELVERM